MMVIILYNCNNITIIICTLNFIFILFFIKIPNSKKIKLTLTSFYSSNQEIRLGSWRKLISWTIKKLRLVNITSKWLSIFDNKPTASCVVLITRAYLLCYSCPYNSFMVNCIRLYYEYIVGLLLRYNKAKVL